MKKGSTATAEVAVDSEFKLVDMASVPGKGRKKSLARSIIEAAVGNEGRAVEFPLADLEEKDVRALRTRIYTIAREKGVKLVTSVSDGKLYAYTSPAT